MQFSSKEDIDIPIETVFAMLSDAEHYERAALRRGVDVQRLGEASKPGVGTQWHARFTMRGKPRTLLISLEAQVPPQSLRFHGASDGIDAHLDLDLVELSPRRTRLAIILNLKPRTLSARLFLQSLKLAKSTLTKRFKLRIADFAKSLEDRGRKRNADTSTGAAQYRPGSAG